MRSSITASWIDSPICGAARPTPGAARVVAHLLNQMFGRDTSDLIALVLQNRERLRPDAILNSMKILRACVECQHPVATAPGSVIEAHPTDRLSFNPGKLGHYRFWGLLASAALV